MNPSESKSPGRALLPDPLVSICIPAYNAERYLPETLESIRTQTYSNWELIVTEDGSRDRTEKIVDTFASTVSQSVRYSRHDPNRGLPATRNAGIAENQGKLIALLDSDDLWLPDHLTHLVAMFNQTGAGIVHSGSEIFDSATNQTISLRAPTPKQVADFPCSLFEGHYVIQPASVLMTRETWKRVSGFDPEFRYVEDREMWLRCARAGVLFTFSGRNTCRYRRHSGTLSRHAAEMAEASARVFQKHLDWDQIPLDLRIHYASKAWTSAGLLRQRASPMLAADHFKRACSIQWSWQAWLRARICIVLAYFRAPGHLSPK